MLLHDRDGHFGRRIRPNFRLGSARQHVNYSAELWQKFGVNFAVLRLRRFALI